MAHSPLRPHAAYIEDYNEDAHTTVPDSRQTANVAAKRSKPDISAVKLSDLGRDGASDSGYSSHTAATLNSGNSSALGSKPGSATLTLDTSLESLAPSKRRPPLTERQTHPMPQSPHKPASRRSESRARAKESVRQGSCKCEECQAKAKSNPLQTTTSPQDTSPHHPAQGRQTPGPQAPHPPTSRSSRPAALPTADAPIVQPAQPAQPRPRHPRPQSYRSMPRPVSFHGGVMPQPLYYQPIAIGRPPSAFATHPQFPPPSYPPPSFPPPTNSYFPSPYQHPHLPPPATHQPSPTMPRELYSIPPSPYSLPPHPQPRQWPMEQYQPPRQPITYSAPPVVEYSHPAQYGGPPQPSHPPMHRTFSERDRERRMPLREEHFPFDEAYYQMPPPPPPPPKPPNAMLQRPSIRHAVTTAARASHAERGLADDSTEEEQIPRSPRKHSGETYDRSSRPALASRPSNGRNSDKSHGLDRLEQNFAQMTVEGSSAAAKQKRRMTYYGGPISKDLERQVEAYQADRTPNVDAAMIPLTADSLKLVRRKTQTSNSDAGSRASGEGRASREGSDVKPRSATGRRGSSDTKPRNEHDAFTMRFNASQGVNVDLKGGAEGRTISLRQSREGEGNMEFSIRAKNEARERSHRRQSYVDGTTVRELESIRTGSRMGRSSREADGDRLKDGSVAASRSRRSSRNRRALME
ncbi:MAG: hypothetical protein LQ344_007525 [Seirophora lacunosa]|nr:MAG: hypothetical protein LQ344_007525 [Seirophora lacunosa]